MSGADSQLASELLCDLNGPQAEAVTHANGPLLVLAGPGSGKTRVITRRVGHLIRVVGAAPWNVLAITFTNKAAGEMKSRIADLISERQARAITVSTFHSLCARLLRIYADRLGLPVGYSIYDTADQQRVIKRSLEELEINAKNFPPAGVLASISNAKNELIDAKAYTANVSDFYGRTVARVYTKYTEILERNRAMDFDDLLLNTVQLLRQQPAVLSELQDRYRYVLIDEYQDTNHAQFLIASALAARHKNLCATGDPDQSIYGWRGANIGNILEFESHYPDAKVVRLEQNYRSTQRILGVADAMIQNNRARKHKTLWTDNLEGEPVRVLTCRDEQHESRCISESLQRLHDDEQIPWGSMAVFYRINSLSRVIEDELRSAGVPYQIARGTAFYDRKEIKDAVAYLRAIVNPADEVNLLRIINTPTRGISEKSVKAIQAHSLAHQTTVDELIRNPLLVSSLNNRAQNSVARFGKSLDQWQRRLEESGLTLRGFIELLLRESGLEEMCRNDKSDPDQERLANLGELVSSAQQFEQEYVFEIQLGDEDHTPSLNELLMAMLERISLVSDVDAVDSDQGAVTLMTLHAAKGLEFDAVAIIGVEDGLLPHQRAREDEHELEEERRLCFVGITRAMRCLILSHARYRLVFGQSMPTIPSRFLEEFPANLIECNEPDSIDAHGGTVRNDGRGERALAGELAGEFPPGSIVRHPDFGLGRVLHVAPMGAHTRARITFNTAGTKTLILQYARLAKVEEFTENGF